MRFHIQLCNRRFALDYTHAGSVERVYGTMELTIIKLMINLRNDFTSEALLIMKSHALKQVQRH